jgi:hypothetical protein
MRLLATVLLVLSCLAVAPVRTGAAAGIHLVSVSGRTVVAGHPVQLDLLLAVPAGADEKALATRALRRASAVATRQDVSSDFSLTGPKWPQFFDRRRSNDLVTLQYNPAGQTLGGVSDALARAAATWSAVPTSTFRLVVGATTTAVGGYDGLNTVYWPSVWTQDPSTIALTTLFYDTRNDFTLDADVAINRDWSFATDGSPGAIDLQSVLLHEEGHVAGLDHSQVREAVMWPFLDNGEVRRTLAQDDVDAISTLYPLDFAPIHLPKPPSDKPPKPQRPPTGPVPGPGVLLRDGDQSPDGGYYVNDFGGFEPFAINDAGTLAFAADTVNPATFDSREGVYLAGKDTRIFADTNQPAPGGGVFGAGVAYGIGLNSSRRAAFTFYLDPFEVPFGVNAGVYRLDQGVLSAVVVPGTTPAPGGGLFRGAGDHTVIDNAGDVVFAGIYDTSAGISGDLGAGVFRQRPDGVIEQVAAPGQPAPGGGVFDFADKPSVNDAGDVAFGAHVAGEECTTSRSQDQFIHCDESVYVRARHGSITSIAHQGDPMPGGGVLREAQLPQIDAYGNVVFAGDTTPAPGRHVDVGVYRWSAGTLTAIATPGTPMPGGGNLLTAFPLTAVNDNGQVAFEAVLDTDTLGLGYDTGLYVWDGSLHLVARTGSTLPSGELVDEIYFPSEALNDAGMLAYSAFTESPQYGQVSVLALAQV